MDGAPFYGSYASLPPSQAKAEAHFVAGAYWLGAEGHDGYYLIHRDVRPDGEGIYRFDAAAWRQMRPYSQNE